MKNRDRNTFAIREYAVILFFVAIACISLAESVRILQEKPQVNSPGLLPIVLSGIMAVCITIILTQTKKQIPKDREIYDSKIKLISDAVREEFPIDMVGTVLITIAYLLVLDVLLYVPATILFMIALMLFFGRKKLGIKDLLTFALTAAGVTAAIYVIFGMVFLVTLP